MKYSSLLIPLAFMTISVAQVPVSGRVVGATGAPVSGASVAAFPAEGEFAGNIHWSKTDETGHFTLHLSQGKYVIRAKDEALGYPDPSFLLNLDTSSKFPTVLVGKENLTGVTVVFGARGGILFGHVQNAHNRNPVPGAKIRVQDARNGAYVEVFSGHDGNFEYALPAKPLRVSITAQGYRGTSVDGGGEVILSPGEHRDLNVELEPESSHAEK